MIHMKNITFIRQFFEEQTNQGDTSRYEEFISPHVVIHGPASGQKTEGIEKAKNLDDAYINTYSKKQFLIEEIFSFGSRVFVRWKCEGKHKKPFKGLRQKNAEFSISGLSIYRIEQEKICEIWQYWDRLGLSEQIG